MDGVPSEFPIITRRPACLPPAMSYFAQSKLLWSPLQPKSTGAEALRRYINRKHGLQLGEELQKCYIIYTSYVNTGTYHDLHKYSVEHYVFWLDLWEYVGIISSVPPQKVSSISDVPLCVRINYRTLGLYFGERKIRRNTHLVSRRKAQLRRKLAPQTR